MPRDLFGDVTRPSIQIGTRKWYTVPVSLLSHVIGLAVVVIAPLMAVGVVPSPADSVSVYVIHDVPPPPPPPRVERTPQPPSDPNVAPTEAPAGITPEVERPDLQPFETTTPSTVIGEFDDGVPAAPIVQAPPAPQKPLRVGGTIRSPQKLHDVAPVYPPLAIAARVQGRVIIEATIAADGRVAEARVLRSVPLLDEAALDAVRQWTYSPTLLNGVPVPVIMTVTVTFTLTR